MTSPTSRDRHSTIIDQLPQKISKGSQRQRSQSVSIQTTKTPQHLRVQTIVEALPSEPTTISPRLSVRLSIQIPSKQQINAAALIEPKTDTATPCSTAVTTMHTSVPSLSTSCESDTTQTLTGTPSHNSSSTPPETPNANNSNLMTTETTKDSFSASSAPSQTDHSNLMTAETTKVSFSSSSAATQKTTASKYDKPQFDTKIGDITELDRERLQNLEKWKAECKGLFIKSTHITRVKSRHFFNLSAKTIANEVSSNIGQKEITNLINSAKTKNIRVYSVFMTLRNTIAKELKSAGYNRNNIQLNKKAADIVAHLIENCDCENNYKTFLVANAARWGKRPQQAFHLIAKEFDFSGTEESDLNEARIAIRADLYEKMGYSAPDQSNSTEAAEILHFVLENKKKLTQQSEKIEQLKNLQLLNMSQRGISYAEWKEALKSLTGCTGKEAEAKAKDLEESFIKQCKVSKRILQDRLEEAIKAFNKAIPNAELAIGPFFDSEVEKLREPTKAFIGPKEQSLFPEFLLFESIDLRAKKEILEEQLITTPNIDLSFEKEKITAEFLLLSSITEDYKMRPTDLIDEMLANKYINFSEKNRINLLKKDPSVFNSQFYVLKFALLQKLQQKEAPQFDDMLVSNLFDKRILERRRRISELLRIPSVKTNINEGKEMLKHYQKELLENFYANRMYNLYSCFETHLLQLQEIPISNSHDQYCNALISKIQENLVDLDILEKHFKDDDDAKKLEVSQEKFKEFKKWCQNYRDYLTGTKDAELSNKSDSEKEEIFKKRQAIQPKLNAKIQEMQKALQRLEIYKQRSAATDVELEKEKNRLRYELEFVELMLDEKPSEISTELREQRLTVKQEEALLQNALNEQEKLSRKLLGRFSNLLKLC